MSEYKKTALVLGAGGFIGSHMVKRLRSEGYWVRGVDLKHPEFTDTEANEFVQGDLRDADFVRKVIQYKGEQGNFYNEVPYRYIEPFHEIYQFAADMGGAGFVFTGENDAEIMQNSVTINLNILEQQRLLDQTFDGKQGWSECNRPVLDFRTKIFYSGSACMYPEHNQLDPNDPNCREDSHTQLHQIPNTDGRNFFQRDCTWLTIVIMAFLFVLLATIISSDQKEHGREVERKLQQQYAERLLMQNKMRQLKYGEMESKLDPSSTLTNVLKQPEDLWNPTSLGQ